MPEVGSFPEPQLHPEVRPRRRVPGQPEPVIVAAARTAIGKFMGSLAGLPAPKLGAAVVRELVRRSNIDPALVDEVVMGNVLSAGLGQNPARQAAIGGGLPSTVSALTINKVCASGLQAVALAAQAIRCGDFEVVIAGGMESMSNAPYLLKGARDGYRLGHSQLVDSMIADGLWDCYYDFHMGNTGELVARRYDIGREQQDDYALASHRKAVQAAEAGRFREEIVPVEVADSRGNPRRFDTDECPRADTDREKLGKLRPAFDPAGTVTAGNAPGVNDGAAALLVMSEERAVALGLRPLARILDSYSAGLDPAWVMLTPVPSVRGLLARNPEWSLDDFSVVELNEAFSVQALAVARELELPPERMNPNGGAVALGHPIGASGARILVTLVHELCRRGGGKGLASLCLGGGNGLALAVEVA
ncbi:MAG: acetyl-CoA C-acetyltransferase [Armatimonadetes bacterium]|nr:acetyl-CoA C-acetyltransferase [Armatimonadota bacterium]